MKKTIITAGVFATFVVMTAQSAYAEGAGKFSLTTGLDYSSGTYGGSQSTDIVYIPVTAKYREGGWRLKLTVPYLQIAGPGNVVKGVGVTRTAAATTRTTQSGLGDVVVAATHAVYSDAASGLMVNLTGKIKFGTASSAKGLGTGKNDYAVQSGLYKTTGQLTTFGTLGYKVYGKPAGYRLNNVFYGSLGGSYRFSAETNAGMMLNLRQRTTAAGSPLREAFLFISQKMNDRWKSQGYLLKGFTNSSPGWGVGASATYLF